jgi:DNA-binding transcriptional LysR family regulator
VNDRGLRYFLAVVRTGSIRAAADSLHVAASAVSRQIAEMEAACGSLLLERLPRGVIPTDAGKIVAEHARQQADETARLEDRLRRLRGVQQGTVGIWCGGGFVPDLMDNGLASFASAHPGIAFRVSLDTTQRILAAIAAGDADIGIAFNPPAHPDAHALVVSRQPIVAILRPDQAPPAGPGPTALRDFVATPAALLPATHGVRQLLGRVEADGGFRLAMRLETGSFELQRRFVLAGLGAAFLPAFAAATELREGRFVAVALNDPLLLQATVHLLVRSGRRLPAAVHELASWMAGHLVSLAATHGA